MPEVCTRDLIPCAMELYSKAPLFEHSGPQPTNTIMPMILHTSNLALRTASGLSRKPIATRVHPPDKRLASGVSLGRVVPLPPAAEVEGAAKAGILASRALTDWRV